MTVYFFDSSALIKRYVNEVGSVWVQSVVAPENRNPIVVARIAWVEVLSALARLEREKALTADTVAATIRAFRYDWDTQYQAIELDQKLALAAGQLVLRHPLRAYDSVQLASALKLQPALTAVSAAAYTFVSADARLLTIAQAEGLLTDDPNLHP